MQKKYIYRTAKIILLAAMLLTVLFVLQNILRHKSIYKLDETPETEMWQEFYGLEKNSLDVVFFGNSHVYNGINPAVLYEETGLKSFDMSSSNQDLFVSYHLFKEMLKTQSPSVVVLDTYALHLNLTPKEESMRSTYYKMAFDDMKLSSNKIEAVREWKKEKDDIDIVERLFPIFEYHSRWEELNDADFSKDALRSVNLGYAYSFKTCEGKEFKGYDLYDEPMEPDYKYRAQLDKIIKLANENNIELILVLLPDMTIESGTAAATGQIADENGLMFLDYNEASRLNVLNIVPEKEMRDVHHMNAFGAVKLTKALAKDLTDLGVVSSGSNAYFDKKLSYHNKVMLNREVSTIEDYGTYVDTVLNNEYIVFVSAKEEAFDGLTDSDKDALMRGFTGLDLSDCWGRSFVGVSGPEKYFLNKDDHLCRSDGRASYTILNTEKIDLSSTLKDGTGFELESIGYFAGAESEDGFNAEIKVAGRDLAENENGLNFVIYDPLTKEVIDWCVFISSVEDKPIYRSFYLDR